VAIARVADADAQPPVVVGVEVGGSVLQSVVAAEAAAELQPQLAGRDVELVVHDEDLGGLDAVEARQRADGLAGAVHEGLWHQQPHAGFARIGDQTVETGFEREVRAERVGEPLTKPKPGVVPGFGIFGARIAETDDQTRRARRRSAHRGAVSGIRVAGREVAQAASPSPSPSPSATAPLTSSAVATTGSPSPWPTSSTPAGSLSCDTWTDWPTSSADRSTSTNSGRSFGRHSTSISLMVCEIMQPPSLTAGQASSPTKCSGTFRCIFSPAATRWKSMCSTCCLNGCHWVSRSTTLSALPSTSMLST